MDTIAKIEMSKGTKYKYEINKTNGSLHLDRVVLASIPHSYGFILNTLSPDGDQLDVFIASMEPLIPLSEVKIDVVAVLKGIDKGLEDDKIIAYIAGDEESKRAFPLQSFINDCISYLLTYKTGFNIAGLGDKEEALNILNKAYKNGLT